MVGHTHGQILDPELAHARGLRATEPFPSEQRNQGHNAVSSGPSQPKGGPQVAAALPGIQHLLSVKPVGADGHGTQRRGGGLGSRARLVSPAE